MVSNELIDFLQEKETRFPGERIHSPYQRGDAATHPSEVIHPRTKEERRKPGLNYLYHDTATSSAGQ